MDFYIKSLYTKEEVNFFYDILEDYMKRKKRKLSIEELIDCAVYDRNDKLLKFLQYAEALSRYIALKEKLDKANFNLQKRGKLLSRIYTEREEIDFGKKIKKLTNGIKKGFNELYNIAIKNEDWDLIEYLFFANGVVVRENINKKIREEVKKGSKKGEDYDFIDNLFYTNN